MSSYVFAYGTISDFNFTGLKRTKESFIKEKLEKFIGQDATEENLKKIDDALHLENLFSEISVKYDDYKSSSRVVNIEVKEKMYLLAAPVGMISDGQIIGGVFIADTNVFGIKDTAVAGALFSKNMQSVQGGYSHRPKGYIPGFGFTADFSNKKEATFVTKDNHKYLETKLRVTNIGASLTEQVAQYLSASAFATLRFLNTGDIYIEDYLSDKTRFLLGTSATLGTSKWNGCFTLSQSLTIKEETIFLTKGRTGQTFSGNLHLDFPIIEPLKLSLMASGFYGTNLYITEMQGNYAAGVKLFRDDFVSPRLAGTNAELEWAVFRHRLGTLSLYTNVQWAVAQDTDEEYENVWGAGGGIKVYIAQVAVPAIGLGGLYNITDRRFIFNFSLGMNF